MAVNLAQLVSNTLEPYILITYAKLLWSAGELIVVLLVALLWDTISHGSSHWSYLLYFCLLN